MAIKWEDVKRLVELDAVVKRYEDEWDALIERDAIGKLATTFKLPFKPVNDKPPHIKIVTAVAERYRAAGWSVRVIDPNMEGELFGALVLGPP